MPICRGSDAGNVHTKPIGNIALEDVSPHKSEDGLAEGSVSMTPDKNKGSTSNDAKSTAPLSILLADNTPYPPVVHKVPKNNA